MVAIIAGALIGFKHKNPIRKRKLSIRDLCGIIVPMLIVIVLLMRKGKIMAISYIRLWKL